LAGRILLKVEDLGRAVYVNPVDLKLYQLNSPIEAYNILKKFGLGITDINLNKITNGTMLSVKKGAESSHSVAVDNPPSFQSASLQSSVTIPTQIKFSGIATDDIGLQDITMKVSGPRGSDITAFTQSLNGVTSKNLNEYYFDSAHSTYANQAGSYTVTLIIKDTNNQTKSQGFTVSVVKSGQCGNGIVEEGETSENCCIDVGCYEIVYNNGVWSTSKEDYLIWFSRNNITLIEEKGTITQETIDRLSSFVKLFYLTKDNKIGFRHRPNEFKLSFASSGGGGLYGVSQSASCLIIEDTLAFGALAPTWENSLAHEFGHMISTAETVQLPESWKLPAVSCNVPMTDEKGEDLTELCQDESCFTGCCGILPRTEDFAEVFRMYSLHGPEFRQEIVSDPNSILAKKYKWMQENIFNGKEFTSSKL